MKSDLSKFEYSFDAGSNFDDGASIPTGVKNTQVVLSSAGALSYNGGTNQTLDLDDINDTGETFNYINKNFGGEDRVRTAAIIHNAPSKFEKLNYYCYGIDKDVLPCWIVFPWEEW